MDTKRAVLAIRQGALIGLASLGFLRVGVLIGVAEFTPRAEVLATLAMAVAMSIFAYLRPERILVPAGRRA